MASSGHSLAEIRHEWTPALLFRMAEAAGRRRRREWVLLAEVIAAGVSAGVSGKWKPIEALGRALGVPVASSSHAAAAGSDVEQLISRLYARIGLNRGDAHSRRARG